MAVSMRDLDSAFQGAGQKPGTEIWRIETFHPVPIPKSSHGKFFRGDSYIVLKTTALKSGVLHHDIHYWLGKDTSQDEAGVAAIKTVELDAALGGRAVQYREVQGHETAKFLSYFKPCIIPQEGGMASGFKRMEGDEHRTRLFACRGKHVVYVKEVPFARSSLNHDDIFILDTKSKIFQFSGSNSSIQERAKALEVVQYIKDTYHDGKCEVAAVEDGKLNADAENGEFWSFFRGFAPLPRKIASNDEISVEFTSAKLFCVEKGQAELLKTDSLTREMLSTDKCYVLDSGLEIFVWVGRDTSLDERKSACGAAEEIIRTLDRSKSQVIRVIEGFETVTFRSKFDSWPQAADVAVSKDGRGRVAALLQRQGVNVRGLLKAAPAKEEPKSYIDCSGNLQVWRVNGQEKVLLQDVDQSKFYSGDCYIFQYFYPGEDKEEVLIGTWLGKQSVEENRAAAISMTTKIIESMKFLPAQARIYEGKEPIEFFVIMQSFIVFKGGLSDDYKNHITDREISDDTYNEDGVALFRVQGSGPENMQAIQVDPVASSLNSSYCYILHEGSTVFTWSGHLTTPEDQELVQRQLDFIKPNVQTKPQKEGSESEQFWELLQGKSEYPSKKSAEEPESDPHLFSCTFTYDDTGNLKVTEIYNFTQDDLMTEDIFILDCHSDIFVWVGKQVDPKIKLLALTIGEKFVEKDILLENLSHEVPIYVVMEDGEPPFFTRFFNWDSSKTAMHGDSFQRKLAIVRNGGTPDLHNPSRRTPASYGGRSSVAQWQQRSRSMTFSPDRVRVRGRSPAFKAIAANFENPNSRYLSTPPQMVKRAQPRYLTPDSAKPPRRSPSIAARSAVFEQTARPQREPLIPRAVKVSLKALEAPMPETKSKEKENSMSNKIESSTIRKNGKEGEADDSYLSSEEFNAKFGMSRDDFYKLPKWKQNKFKTAVQLF